MQKSKTGSFNERHQYLSIRINSLDGRFQECEENVPVEAKEQIGLLPDAE